MYIIFYIQYIIAARFRLRKRKRLGCIIYLYGKYLIYGMYTKIEITEKRRHTIGTDVLLTFVQYSF